MNKLTIEIEGGEHKVVVRDSAGNEKTGNACVISIGNSHTDDIYLFAWGNPKDAAWSLGEGLARSQGDPWWDGFICCHAQDMYLRCAKFDNVTPSELLERLEQEDKDKKRLEEERRKGAN